MLSEDNSVSVSLSDDEKKPEPVILSFAAPAETSPSLLHDELDEPEETAPSRLMLSEPAPAPSPSSSSVPSNFASPSVQGTNHVLNITIKEFEKRGDGMNAFIVYKVCCTSENVPGYSDRTTEVWRRFSDFLGLRDKLVEKHQARGIVIPPAPEKSIAVMTKAKTAADVHQANDLAVKRARQLERFLCRVVQHPKLRCDCDVRDFLTFPGDLPHSSQTVALSGAGVKRMFNKFTDVFNKMAFHMEEGDRWFEQALSQVEELDDSLKKVLHLAEQLAGTRKELSSAQESMSRALSMLASCEESTSLARALSHLTETEEGVAILWAKQADQDTIKFTEAIQEYVGLLASLKEVFHERVRLWQKWQDSQSVLHKKRENKSRMELSGKLDRANQLKNEIEETSKKMDQQEQEFMELSKVIRDEITRFEGQRRVDMRKIFIEYLESLVLTHSEMLKLWEKFAPESAAIIV